MLRTPARSSAAADLAVAEAALYARRNFLQDAVARRLFEEPHERLDFGMKLDQLWVTCASSPETLLESLAKRRGHREQRARQR